MKVSPSGFEPLTFGFGGRRSIQLSYGDKRKRSVVATPRASSATIGLDPYLIDLRLALKVAWRRRLAQKPRLVRFHLAAYIAAR